MHDISNVQNSIYQIFFMSVSIYLYYKTITTTINNTYICAGLKRTGKSCRLRWLNYLRPDVKRGDFTADEQLLILDLHSRWGNRYVCNPAGMHHLI
jgi:hypothetical protein